MTSSPTAHEIDALFEKMLDLPEGDREEHLNALSKENPELADAVRSLLEAGVKGDALLEASASEARDAIFGEIAGNWESRADDSGDARVGNSIGPYAITGVIGRGGRSTVYAATREGEEWVQDVALKILRRGIDTDDVIARFHSERQILSRLVHPGIAAILDAGATDDGLPYFAMDKIDGQPITDHCFSHGLGLHQRLKIFLQVAEAVSFAHRHLVVHRDIKPSNILVSADGKATLLDFGISKVLDADAMGGPSVRTRTDIRPLTPDYAAPEQVQGQAITTATDVYQLGLLLAKMLTGNLPGGRNPSLDQEIPTISDLASTELAARPPDGVPLPYGAKDLAGDIDTIIQKATRPEPERRYASVRALMDDIGRYLDNQPIGARPPTIGYRLRKFARRQPWAVPVAAFGALSLFAYLVTVTLYAERLQDERDLKAAEAARAEEIKSFLVDFLKAPDPYEGEGYDVTMLQALNSAEVRAERDLEARPGLQAEIFGALADVFANLGIHDRAVPLWERQAAHHDEAEGQELEGLLIRMKRANSLHSLGQSAEAVEDLRQIAGTLEELYPDRMNDLAEAYTYLGQITALSGDIEQAIVDLERATAIARSGGPEGEETLAIALHALGLAHGRRDQHEAALAAFDEAIAIRGRLFGETSLLVTQTLMGRGDTLTFMGRFEEAEEIYRRATKQFEPILGPSHDETLSAQGNIAYIRNRLKDHDVAAEIYADVLARKRQKYDKEPTMSVVIGMVNLATSYSYLDRNHEAAALLIEARATMENLVEPGHFQLAFPDMTLAHIYEVLADYEAMEMVSRRALEILSAAMPRGQAVREVAQCRLGGALILQGRTAEGRPMVEEAIDELVKAEGPPHNIADCQTYLAF